MVDLVVEERASSLWPEGSVDGHHYFRDARGRLYSSTTPLGALQPLTHDPSIHAWARTGSESDRRFGDITLDGEYVFASHGGLGQASVPGRVYDARFLDSRVGVALVEPGRVFVTVDAGETFAAATLSGTAPVSIDELGADQLPGHALVDTPRVRYQAGPLSPPTRGHHARWLDRLGVTARTAGVSVPDLVGVSFDSLDAGGEPEMIFEFAPLAYGWAVSNEDGRMWVVDGRGHARAFENTLDLVARDGGAAVVRVTHPDGGHVTQIISLRGDPPLRVGVHVPDAAIVALAGRSLVIGGDGCPPAMCAAAPLVRVDVGAAGETHVSPYRVEGVALRSPDPHMSLYRPLGSRVSSEVVSGDQIRLALPTATGLALVSGPLAGPLRAMALPAPRGRLAFADADHGVFASDDERLWVTADAGRTWDAVEVVVNALVPDSRTEWRDGVDRLTCSADACRIGSAYWASARFADALALGPTRAVHFTSDSMLAPEATPWSIGTPRVREPPPTTRCPPLDAGDPSIALTTLGGAVVHFHVDARGTQRAVSWSVANGAGGREVQLPGEATVGGHGHRLVADAATAELLILRAVAPDGRTRLVSVPRRGRARVIERTAMPGSRPGGEGMVHLRTVPVAFLPRSEGGLALLFSHGAERYVIDFDATGRVRGERHLMAFPVHRDELLVEHLGAIGLAVFSAAEDAGGLLFATDGSVHELPRIAAPDALCASTTSGARPVLRAAGPWRTPRPPSCIRDSEDGRLFLSEHGPASACVRAVFPSAATADARGP